YIKSRLVDIGDRVKEGQLLVEIDTPELDEQLRQTRYRYSQFLAQSGATKAALVLAEANLKLAGVTLKRTEKLVAEGVFSRQELDDKKALYDVRAAEVASADANVKAAEEGKRAVNSDVERLLSLTRYQRVTAPFHGIITSRTCEVGNLISAASVSSGRELFRVADPQELSVMVNVPQPDASSIRLGMPAELLVAEFPGRRFLGKVDRTANALDANSRTMLTKIKIDNRDGALLPGMFGEVKLQAARSNVPLLIRGDTPIVRAGGVFVATVDDGGIVHFRKIKVARDLGSEVEVVEGLSGGELLIVNPSDEVREGAAVRIRQ
ncbi:MAG: efflux RND transporter periplasmic adaptor subunit, partial [Candidatus Solibacter usitatus]|nr:efflux RND transporter periplasmic adaptor subunit [Candidatus Solibacter usitatus]